MEYVKYMLENYREIKGMIKMLRHQLATFSGVTDDEAVEVLTYAKAEGERVSNSSVSDKTGKVALVYKEYAKRINREGKQDIRQNIASLEYEIGFLENAVESLPPRECNILKDIYFEQMQQVEVACKLNITYRWLAKIKQKAIKKLVCIYEGGMHIVKNVEQ